MCGVCKKVWHHCFVHKNIHTRLVLEDTCQRDLYNFPCPGNLMVIYKTNYITLMFTRNAIRISNNPLSPPPFAGFCIATTEAHVKFQAEICN